MRAVISPRMLILAGGCALALAGCGASDQDQINAIITGASANPATVCDHLSQNLLQRAGNTLTACRQLARSAPKNPNVTIRQIKITGSTATASFSDSAGSYTLTLQKQNGNWKITGER